MTNPSGNLCSFILLALAVLLQLAVTADGISVQEELTLSQKEKSALDKFREVISPRLTQEYMKRDIYLIRWLRESKLNLEDAERKLLNNLKWRKENNVDRIEFLDWGNIGNNFPYTTDVYDREGRPTFVLNFGDWDIRVAAVSGNTNKLILYWAKIIEEMNAKVRALQKEGRMVTQANLIIDIKEYNLIQHGCTQCLPVYLGLISLMRERYPGDINKAYVVNAPRVFEIMLQALRPYMGPTGDSFKVFGNSKREWKKYLLQDFSEDQLPQLLGGTKLIDDLDNF